MKTMNLIEMEVGNSFELTGMEEKRWKRRRRRRRRKRRRRRRRPYCLRNFFYLPFVSLATDRS